MSKGSFEYETSVLLHWNAEKQCDERWLYIALKRWTMQSYVYVTSIAREILNRCPPVVVSADEYLWKNDLKKSTGWLAGPLTEEEAEKL